MLLLYIIFKLGHKIIEVAIYRCEAIGVVDINRPAKSKWFNFYMGNIVLEFYLRGKKKFSALAKEKFNA